MKLFDTGVGKMKDARERYERVEKTKRVIAMGTVIILGLMIVATLVVACLDFPGSDKVFMGLLLMDGVVPVFLWFFLHFYKKATQKATEGTEEK